MTTSNNPLDETQYTYLTLLLENGCKFKLRTILFGKEYVWMQDTEGAIFLERLPEGFNA